MSDSVDGARPSRVSSARLTFDMQAKDAIIPAGRRIGLMVFSTDRQYHIRPAPGTQVSLDLAGCSFTIPIVGGAERARRGDRRRRSRRRRSAAPSRRR